MTRKTTTGRPGRPRTAGRTSSGRPPTGPEIRKALEDNLAARFIEQRISFDDAVWDLLDPVMDSDQALVRAVWVEGFHPPKDHPGTLWADLRSSETEELLEGLSRIVIDAEVEITKLIIDRVVAFAAGYAERHPDIPRGHWPLPPAD